MKFIKVDYLIVFLIISIGLLLRIHGVLTNSFAYTYDVGRDMLILQGITQYFDIPLIGPTSGHQGIFYGPWWYYLLTIPYVLGKGNPQIIALFIGVLGIVSSVILYVTGVRIENRFLGILFAFLSVISPSLMTIQIWNPYMAYLSLSIFFLSLTYIFDRKTTLRKQYIAYFIAGITLGLTIDSEIFFGALFSIGVVLSGALLLRKELSVRKVALFFIGVFVLFSPRILFELRHDFLMTNSFIRLLQEGLPQTHYTPFLNRVEYIFSVFFYHWSTTLTNKHMLFATVLLVGVVSVFVIFSSNIQEIVRRFLIVLSSILITFFLYFLTNSTDIFDHFLIGFPLFYVLFFSFAMSLVYTHVSSYLAVSLSTVLLIVLFNPISVYTMFTSPQWEGDASVYRNALNAVDFVYKDANKKPFSVSVFTPTKQTDTYDYLFSWYGEKKYGYKPTSKSTTLYLIIEPDNEFDGYRKKLWLDERKNLGKIEFSRDIAGQIEIQKRSLMGEKEE